MQVALEHVGSRFESASPYHASRAKFAEFAQALKDPNPRYYGEDAIAPPTFAAVIAGQAWAPLFDDVLGLPLNRTIHREQEFEFFKPLKDGDDVWTVVTLEHIGSHPPWVMITVLASLTVAEEPICDIRAKLVFVHDEASLACS